MEIEKDRQGAKEAGEIMSLLLNQEQHYLTGRPGIVYQSAEPLGPKDSILFRVDRITFEEEAPWKEALENVLSAVRIPNINFIYCVAGDEEGVRFYYGLSRDSRFRADQEGAPSVAELGRNVLRPSLMGNYRGSVITELTVEEKRDVLERVQNMKKVSRIEGVPGSLKDDERFQSVDRLVDVMQRSAGPGIAGGSAQGDRFCVLIVANAMEPEEIWQVETSLYKAYSLIAPYGKYGSQEGGNQGDSHSVSETDGRNSGSSNTTGSSKSTTKGTNITSKTSSDGSGRGSSESGQEGSSTSHNTSEGTSHSRTEQTGKNSGTSWSTSREYPDKCIQEWLQYCDDVLLPRLDSGRGKGMFHAAFYVMSDSASVQRKLENTVIALYAGKEKNRVPLRAIPLDPRSKQSLMRKTLQLPQAKFNRSCDSLEIYARSLLSQCVRTDGTWFPVSNWITTKELSMIAGLPRKEVVGLTVREEVEFGLNLGRTAEEPRIPLGMLVKDGLPLKTQVSLRKSSLDKHLFVAGVTGSGKTTTCQSILLRSGLPFLVIEPAKTEYRALREHLGDELLVFTLGNDTVAPFYMNPLEFLPKESITAHVDMLKASLEAAFDMEAAIPQLIEAALYACYEKKGWDIATGRNRYYADPFAPRVSAFPTLSDVVDQVESVVKEQGFDDRLKNDYIGSIRARLQGLLLGAKGNMLNRRRSISFDALLDKKVVLELEGFKSGSEKSLVMGFLLAAFNEAVRERYDREGGKHPHILLVEEAHRLLSKYQPGDSGNKKQGVETFSDMLAEIRKYGECLIIADQIPNKMAEDVLKNTNTKIVHRIFAQDDKEAIGNTMALRDDQKRFLSSLPIGRAIVFTEELEQAVQVQITPETDTSGRPVSDQLLRDRALTYYTEEDDMGLLPPLAKPLEKMTERERQAAEEYLQTRIPVRLLEDQKGEDQAMREKLLFLLERGCVEREQIVEWLLGWLSTLKPENEPAMRAELQACIRAWSEGENPWDVTRIRKYIQGNTRTL